MSCPNPKPWKHPALIPETVQVFENRKYPPDKEFGCFSAIRGPRGSPWEGKALLRVHMGASSKGRTTLKANYVALILLLQDLKKCAPCFQLIGCIHSMLHTSGSGGDS